MKNTIWKKTALSVIACLALVFALLPAAAMAEDTEAVCKRHGLVLRRIDAAEGYACSCCVPGEMAGEEIIIREI